MLISCRSHSSFQQFLRERLLLLVASDPQRLLSFSSALAKVWLFNLDPAIPFLLSRYSSLGRPAKFEPVDLLRSLFLMTHLKVFSITQWVLRLRSDKLLAILSGFEPGKTPSIGVFYDFLNRFWLQDRSQLRNRRLALRPFKAKPRKKVKAGQKLAPKHPGVVQRLVDQALKGRSFSRRPERLLQQIFARCCVDQSVTLRLIPAPQALILAGDGSSLRTGNSPAGVKVCNCKQQELYPLLVVAKTLWDSAHDAYDFYRLHHAWRMEPFIDLNPRNLGHFQNTPPVEVNDHGIPRCSAGHLMVYNGFDKQRRRLKWRCPMVAGSKRLKQQLNCTAPCSSSPYGRTVYTKPNDDLRFFTQTPRNSSAWKEIRHKRSAAERSFKRAKIDYELERCRVRSKQAWFWRLHLVGMNQHLDAWVTNATQNGSDIWTVALGQSLVA